MPEQLLLYPLENEPARHLTLNCIIDELIRNFGVEEITIQDLDPEDGLDVNTIIATQE